MKKIAKFTSPDSNTLLTLRLEHGKRGFNICATLKDRSSKKKANSGARETFKTEKEGLEAFDKMCKESVRRGWSEKAAPASRNAFTAIPDAPVAVVKKQKGAAA